MLCVESQEEAERLIEKVNNRKSRTTEIKCEKDQTSETWKIQSNAGVTADDEKLRLTI